MPTLTVGAGGEFQTISEAIASSHDGDVIEVQAGTYTDDFSMVNNDITIEGVGGMVNLLATRPPPNGKAILTVNADLTIRNFEISGAANASAYGNAAAIRLQTGNLDMENCYIHDNQEGLLADNNLDANVRIDHSEFAFNGSLGNLTQNVYINDVGTAVLSNSYIHDVVGGGTEFRSRGLATTIVNNRIYDNAQNANYVIDVPSGGNVVIDDNVLQKSAAPSNPNVIHWGGSIVVPFHPDSSLDVSDNVIIDNDTSSRVSFAILNQSDLNNPNITDPNNPGDEITIPNLSGNQIYGVAANRVSNLATSLSGNTLQDLSNVPQLDTSHPWTAPTTVWDPTQYDQTLLLTTSKHNITGGAVLLTVTDTVGYNTITGGSGGLAVSVTGNYEIIATSTGTANSLALASRAVVQSAGSDAIRVTGNYNSITVSGNATISAGTTGSNTYTLLGDSVVQTRGIDTTNVIGCNATVTGASTSLYVIETGGNVQFAGTGGSVSQTVTVSGGVATIAGSASGAVITTSGVTGAAVMLGTGAELVKSYGADTISAGSSAATVNVSGSASILAGTGSLYVNGVAGVATVTGSASPFTFVGSAGALSFNGDAGTAYIRAGSAAVTVNGGSGNVTLVGGSGNDVFVAGSGQALITGGNGADTVQFGAGNVTINGGSGGDLYRCVAGQGGGTDLIRSFNVGSDKLDLGGLAIQRQSVSAGALNLNLADGTVIQLAGISSLTSNMLA